MPPFVDNTSVFPFPSEKHVHLAHVRHGHIVVHTHGVGRMVHYGDKVEVVQIGADMNEEGRW